jgi:MFS family permease
MSQPSSEPIHAPTLQRTGTLYGLEFWIAYIANLLIVAANTLTFRFSEFVVSLGGSAADAAFVVGVGMGVSVFVRVWMGRAVDQGGPRWMWLGSAAALALSNLSFMLLDSLNPLVYAVRVVYACGLAGVFSCSVIHVCTGIPVGRRAELIGTLGTSGFIGAIIGPQLGDYIFGGPSLHAYRFALMFTIAAVFCVIYLLLVCYLTRHSTRPAPHEPAPPLLPLLVSHWPGTLVAVATMMGMALTVPSTFLTLFRDERGLDGIGKFFWFYAPTAIFMRLVGRRWPGETGRRLAAFAGLVSLTASMLLYLLVDTEWDLAWPALAAGTGQALLFPAVTTLGAESFPERYRGTATTLILGFIDVGALCGAPALGLLIDHYGFHTTFLCAGGAILVVAMLFLTAMVSRYYQEALDTGSVSLSAEEQLVEW